MMDYQEVAYGVSIRIKINILERPKRTLAEKIVLRSPPDKFE